MWNDTAPTSLRCSGGPATGGCGCDPCGMGQPSGLANQSEALCVPAGGRSFSGAMFSASASAISSKSATMRLRASMIATVSREMSQPASWLRLANSAWERPAPSRCRRIAGPQTFRGNPRENATSHVNSKPRRSLWAGAYKKELQLRLAV